MKTTKSRILTGVSATALMLSVVAGCGSGSNSSLDSKDGEAVKISFGVTNPQLPGSAYVASVPTYLKYWSDQGLDVTFNSFDGSGEVMTAVATGKTTIGSGGTASTMAAIVNGNADTKVFYSYIPNTPYWPVVLPDSPIHTLEDLVGKTVGTFSLAGDGAGVLKGVMKKAGLDPNSVKIIAVGTGAEAMETLRKGRIAAYLGYDSVYGEIENLGFKVRKVDTPMDDYKFMGGIVARESALKDNKDVLVKFGRGLAEAATFIKANPECALKIQWKVYPESKPAGMSEKEAVASGLVSLMSRLTNQQPVDGQWGRVTADSVQKRIDVGVLGGQLPKAVSVDQVWDPELLDQINDFDKAAVEKSAKECKMVGN